MKMTTETPGAPSNAWAWINDALDSAHTGTYQLSSNRTRWNGTFVAPCPCGAEAAVWNAYTSQVQYCVCLTTKTP